MYSSVRCDTVSSLYNLIGRRNVLELPRREARLGPGVMDSPAVVLRDISLRRHSPHALKRVYEEDRNKTEEQSEYCGRARRR